MIPFFGETARRVALYVRVSTDGQRENNTIALQETELQKFATANNCSIVDIYRDDGVSGGTTNRPELNRLLSDASLHRFECVLVWAVDRLGRADLTDMLLLRKEFNELGIAVFDAQVGREIGAGDELSELMYAIESWQASKERRDIAERTRRGKRRSVGEGRFGGGVMPYGYTTDSSHRLVILEDQAKAVRLAYEWTVYEDLSAQRIAERLNSRGLLPQTSSNTHRSSSGKWTCDRVRQTLRNPIYRGERNWGKRSRSSSPASVIVVECPAIVSAELWTKAQAALDRRRTFKGPRDSMKYPLTGLIKCAECGRPMSGAQQKQYRYYRCQGF